MSLTGTIPVLFQGDFAYLGPFFIYFYFFKYLRRDRTFFRLHEFVDTFKNRTNT